ncbi:hypothetical protein ACF05W_33090 [Streptomyces lydicus]|uniref:hypothetical protein n=1 Tax=Streptomyces lydicus TaxID=47763 RepID=UPI003701DEE6
MRPAPHATARGALKYADGVCGATWLTYTDSSQPRCSPGATKNSSARVEATATAASGRVLRAATPARVGQGRGSIGGYFPAADVAAAFWK